MSPEKRESKSAGSGKKEKDDCSEDDHKKNKSPDDQLLPTECSRVNKKPCNPKNLFNLSSIGVLAGGNNKLPAAPNNPVVHAATETSSQETKEALGLKVPEDKSGQGNDNNSSAATATDTARLKNQDPKKSGVTSQPQPKDTFGLSIFPQISGEGNKVSKNENSEKKQPSSSGKTTDSSTATATARLPTNQAPKKSGVTSQPQPQPKDTFGLSIFPQISGEGNKVSKKENTEKKQPSSSGKTTEDG